MTAIDAQELRKSYGARPAVDGINLTVQPGEVFALLMLTTHYLAEAEALADRLAVIAGGRIVAEGTPQDIGGRATAPATVSWSDAAGSHQVRTTDPTALVAQLPARADGAVTDLNVRRPSLEDIYLELIGDRS